jgi:hypothetical protein
MTGWQSASPYSLASEPTGRPKILMPFFTDSEQLYAAMKALMARVEE